MTQHFATSGQVFQDVLFTNTTVYPFEIHRLIPRVYALDTGGLLVSAQPDQSLLAALVRLDILDFRLDLRQTKAPTLIDTLTKGTSERTWEWAEPYTLPNSGGFQVASTTLTVPAALADSVADLRICITFEGFQLQVAAPSDSR